MTLSSSFSRSFFRRCLSLAVLVSIQLQGPPLAFGAPPEAHDAEFLPAGLALGSEGHLAALGGHGWLIGTDDGLLLLKDGVAKKIVDGRFESLDIRSDVMLHGQAFDLITAIDAENGNVAVLSHSAGGGDIQEVRRLAYETAIPKALCLYRNSATSDLSLFALDARGMLEQRYVYDGTSERLVDQLVRRDAGVPDAEACAVDDAQAALYIADEALGVRRLAASEESDAVQEPSLLTEPFGDLSNEVKDAAIDNQGTLWVLVPDSGRVYRRSPEGAVSFLTLPEALDPATLAVMPTEDGSVIAVFDEKEGDVWTATVAMPEEALEAPERVRAYSAQITASRETTPVRRFADAADDPAILAQSASPRGPLILGTDKREGLAVYDLDGTLLQFLPVGRVNNVDAVSAVTVGGATRTIAAASNRSYKSVSLFEETAGTVKHLGDHETGLGDVYGLCMYHSASGLYVFINDTSGAYEQYRVGWTADQPILSLVRQFRLPSQPEGCTADTASQRLYMGEEAAGVWMAGAEPDGQAPVLIIPVGDALVADVEGMDVYRDEDDALLVVSSQGSDSFAVYDLNDAYRLRASFAVRADLALGVDGVSETDGLAITSAALPGFPEGVLIVQDGRNRMPDEPQNFKIIDWRTVQQLME